MLKQRSIVTKTATSMLTYSDIGDVVANPGAAIDLTLPEPLAGLWYRVTNASEHTVTITYDSATVTAIGQNEHALFLANGASAWFFTKAATDLELTKAMVEAVLTGAITSHTHAYAAAPIINASAPTGATVGALGQIYIETTTPTIYYCSAVAAPTYTWTELSGGGGGGASAFTDLTDAPSSYSGAAGKVVKVNSSADGLEFGDPPSGTFIEMTDTPSAYTGYAGKVVKVNSAANGVEFGDVPVITLLGLYATLGDLQTAHPTGSAGDAYAVGTDSENVIYIWDTVTSAWGSIGPLKGADGEDGAGGASTSIWGGI